MDLLPSILFSSLQQFFIQQQRIYYIFVFPVARFFLQKIIRSALIVWVILAAQSVRMTPERGMGTRSFRRNDIWDRLSGQALLIIG